MSNSIQILFEDYNDYLIPYKKINDKKVLILNSSHASLTEDSKFYDESLKITFHLEEKKWTVRSENMARIELSNTKLQNFLLKELEKYEIPAIEDNEGSVENISIKVIDYYLPIEKENSIDYEETREYSMKTIEILKQIGGNKALNFVQTQQKAAIDNIEQGLGKNLSGNSLCKMAYSTANQVANFIIDEKERNVVLHLSDGKYFIDLELDK